MKPLDSLIALIPNRPYKQFLNTDQGWQYRHSRHSMCQNKLKKAHITPSMSRRTACLNNACIESFFNKLKVELANLSTYNSAEKLITAIKKWIIYYNTKRIQMKLGGTESINYQLCAA